MKLLSRTTRTPIAVDMGSRCVKVLQAFLKAGTITRCDIAAMNVSTDAPFSAQHAEQIAALLRRAGFVGREIVIAIPPKLLRMEALELPKVVPTAVRQLAEMEVCRVARMKGKSFEHGLWELPMPSRGGSSLHIMSVALPHADADALCDPFIDAGLNVLALVPQVNALASLATRILPDEDQLHTIIDIGASGTRLIIVQRGAVLFHRAIPAVGTDALTQSVQSELMVPAPVAVHIVKNVGIHPAGRDALGASATRVHQLFTTMIETIASELQLTQNYITHRYQQQSASSLLLVGGGAALPGFAEALGVVTDRQATVLSPRSFASTPAGLESQETSPATVTALAAAVYSIQEDA